jgi:AAA domain-containing protein
MAQDAISPFPRDGNEDSRRDEATPVALVSEAPTQSASPESDTSSYSTESPIEALGEDELNAAIKQPGRSGTAPTEAIRLEQQTPIDSMPAKVELTPQEVQHQIDIAVNAKLQKWRAGKLKDNPRAFIGVAQEVEMRRVFVTAERAERGVARPPVEPMRVQTFESFQVRSFPPKEDLITGLLHRRDIVALVGRRRHGKTTFMANLALSVSLPHANFLGYSIPKAIRVLILYLEDDAGEVQIRLKRMSRGELPGERLALYTREDFFREKIPIRGTNPQFQKFMTDVCAAHCPDVIILDNLAHLVGADYNNPKLIHELATFLFQLTVDFNAAIIIAAHPRKRDKQGKGTPSLRDDPEGFFEEAMGSSHFVNSCGSLWGIERDLSNDRTVFLGGSQRFTGQQSLMTLEKDEDNWLRVLDNLEVNLPLALNTPGRKKAWELLPAEPFSYTEGERAVKPAMSSSSTFHSWFQQCQRLGLIIRVGDRYRRAAGTQPGIVEVSG